MEQIGDLNNDVELDEYEKQKQFNSIKDQLEKIVEKKISEVFNGYAYNGDDAQEYSNKVA